MAQYIYGKNVCMQRISDGKPVRQIILLDGMKDRQLFEMAKKNRIPVEFVERKKLDTLSKGGKHQGVLCVIDEYKTVTVDEILSRIPQGKLPLLVMLDQLEGEDEIDA